MAFRLVTCEEKLSMSENDILFLEQLLLTLSYVYLKLANLHNVIKL